MRPLSTIAVLLLMLAGCGSESPDSGPSDASTGLEPPPPGAGSPVVGRGSASTLEESRDSGSDVPAEPTSSPAPADRPRVVFIGTSLTAGYGLDDPFAQSWPSRMRELARAAGTPIEVVNGGVSGDTSAGGLRRIGPLLDPPADVVIVELGANDGLRGLSVAELRRNLSATLDTVQARSPQARVLLVPMEAPRNLGDAYVRAFRTVYSDLAEREAVTLTLFLLEGIAGVPALNQGDGIHPTAEGHRRMAALIWPTLRSELEIHTPESASR